MFEYIIGLEVHIKLATEHKIFCWCKNSQDFDNTPPNKHICPTCTAQPGGLPIINPECIDTAIRLGHIFQSTINKDFSRDRKSYFYPDSPAGFQITQFRRPILAGGSIKFFTDNFQTEHKIHIHEAHLENDTAKTITIDGTTFIDFNRSGGPLIEIVTKPEFTSDDQVNEFLKELQRIIRRNGIGDADMDKGQMRVDVNISIRPIGSQTLGTRVEVKNINSFASIRKAIAHEHQRHIQLINEGQTIDQETRGRDEANNQTYSLRSKEQAQDYRYFTENDLPQIDPSSINRDSNEQVISGYARIKQMQDFGFHKEYIHGLINNEFLYTRFANALVQNYDPKQIAKRLLGPIAGIYNEGGENNLKLSESNFQEFLRRILESKTPEAICKQVMDELLQTNDIEISRDKFASTSDSEIDLDQIIKNILEENTSIVEQYKGGKTTTIAFFVGQAMKATGGKLDPNTLKAELEKKLNN